MTAGKRYETRARPKLVGVRLSEAEHALLLSVAARSGQTPASVLRYTFLAEYTQDAAREEAS